MSHKLPHTPRLYEAIFNIFNDFNLLDLNLGLCISVMTDLRDPKSAYPKIKGLSFSSKIEELRRVTHDLPCGPDYSNWARRADQIRHLRNRFAHGVWEFYLPTIEKPMGIRMPPWEDGGTDKLSLDELEKIAMEVHDVVQSFFKWRHDHQVWGIESTPN